MIEQTEKRKPVRGRGKGFASMSQEQRSAIASKGGKAAHALGTAHKWTSEEAQAAGRIGGAKSRRGRRAITDEEFEQLRTRIAQQIERGE